MRSVLDRSKFVGKSVAALVGVVLLLGVLFSDFYIASEYNHDCVGDECPICQYVAECEAFVEQVTAGVAFVVVTALVFVVSGVLIKLFCRESFSTTLVSCKVRLNN